MNQKEFFEKVLRALEELKIPYMITGSVGAILFGGPRLTNDMDVVVELPIGAMERLCGEFPPEDFYLPPREVIRSEIDARTQFNLIHVGSGSKVDFIIRKENDFARAEFARRIRVPFLRASCIQPSGCLLTPARAVDTSFPCRSATWQ